MLMAVFGDVNGNFSALKGVFEAIDREGILTVLHTGNAIWGGKKDNEILHFLEQRLVYCVQGNQDRMIVRFKKKEKTYRKKLSEEVFTQVAQSYAGLQSVALEKLAAAPRKLDFEMDGLKILLCHGALSSKNEILSKETAPVRFQREREIEPADIIVTGGAEDPFYRDVEGTLFASPGSLDWKKGKARYLVINTETTPWTCTFHQVDYTP